jgi:hypothetical protein
MVKPAMTVINLMGRYPAIMTWFTYSMPEIHTHFSLPLNQNLQHDLKKNGNTTERNKLQIILISCKKNNKGTIILVYIISFTPLCIS